MSESKQEAVSYRLTPFYSSDFKRLKEIANAINQKSEKERSEGYFPYYAFQVNMKQPDADQLLNERILNFLNMAQAEGKKWPRSTYRLAVRTEKEYLIGSVAIDMLPVRIDGQLFHGDLGYFIDPAYENKGILTRAVCDVMRYYFKTSDRLDITMHPNDTYSRLLIERIGGQLSGYIDRSRYYGEPRSVFVIYPKDFDAAVSKLKEPYVVKRHPSNPLKPDNQKQKS